MPLKIKKKVKLKQSVKVDVNVKGAKNKKVTKDKVIKDKQVIVNVNIRSKKRAKINKEQKNPLQATPVNLPSSMIQRMPDRLLIGPLMDTFKQQQQQQPFQGPSNYPLLGNGPNGGGGPPLMLGGINASPTQSPNINPNQNVLPPQTPPPTSAPQTPVSEPPQSNMTGTPPRDTSPPKEDPLHSSRTDLFGSPVSVRRQAFENPDRRLSFENPVFNTVDTPVKTQEDTAMGATFKPETMESTVLKASGPSRKDLLLQEVKGEQDAITEVDDKILKQIEDLSHVIDKKTYEAYKKTYGKQLGGNTKQIPQLREKKIKELVKLLSPQGKLRSGKLFGVNLESFQGF